MEEKIWFMEAISLSLPAWDVVEFMTSVTFGSYIPAGSDDLGADPFHSSFNFLRSMTFVFEVK